MINPNLDARLDISIDELVKKLNNNESIQYVLSKLINNISNVYPELKEKKNVLLSKLNKNLKEHKLNLEKMKFFLLLYKVASDIVGEKAEKLTKFQNLMEAVTLPISLKEKMLDRKEKISNIIVDAYGMLKQAIEYGDDKSFKTAVVSVLLLGVDSDKEKDITIAMFRDIDREKDVDFSKIEDFFERSKEISNLDTYIKELQKFISIEKEKQQERKSFNIGL